MLFKVPPYITKKSFFFAKRSNLVFFKFSSTFVFISSLWGHGAGYVAEYGAGYRAGHGFEQGPKKKNVTI